MKRGKEEKRKKERNGRSRTANEVILWNIIKEFL
jgi:hypothetical protein